METRLSELRTELVALVEERFATLQEELDELADEAGSANGKLMNALADISNGPRLVRKNDAA